MRPIFPVLLLVQLAHALALPAQSRYALGAYVSRNGALPDAPVLGGGSLAVFAFGPLGVRGGGGVNLNRAAADRVGSSGSGSSAWTADADLILAPLRGSSALASVLGGFAPFGYLGIGVQASHGVDESDGTVATWSYGLGASRALIAGLSAEAEARYRMPLVGDERLPEGFSRAWDYRIGLVLNFGGGRSRSRGGDHRDIPRHPRPETVASASASRVLASADRYVGTRYRYGGSTKEGGFDCSGFVQHVFAEHGVSLPRVSRQQALAGRGVVPLLDALTPGDLVFFAQNGIRIDHVAIYTGRGRIIHSSSSGGGVRYDDLVGTGRGKWFLEHMVAARRVLNDGRSPTAPAVATQPAAVPRPPAVAQVAPDSLDPPDRAPVPVP